MALARWIYFIGLLAVVWLFVAGLVGISGTLPVIGFAFALALTLDYFGIFKIFPFAVPKKMALILLIVLWGYTAWSAGWVTKYLGFGSALPTGSITTGAVTTGVSAVTCQSGLSEYLRGKASTISFNAWDLESNTPYSTAVNFDGNCWYYKNGNEARNYINATLDTVGGTVTGKYSVGDTLTIYCGGTTYYSEPTEGACIDSESETVDINAHTIAGESNMAITGYDDTGATALSSGSNGTDYTVGAMGANSDLSIYVKEKLDSANKAYNFCGWGVFLFKNVTDVVPQDLESTYTEVTAPQHMSGLDVQINTTSSSGGSVTQSGSYRFYKTSSPILMHEWDSIKEQFVVETGTNDPLHDTGPGTQTDAKYFNGFAILSKDCAYARGDDGKVYLDIYQHDTTQADVGMAETEISPQGKQTGAVFEVE